MYGPMSKLQKKPETKSLGAFFKEKWFKTSKKQVFKLVFILVFFPSILGTMRHPQMEPKVCNKAQMEPKGCNKAHKKTGCMAECPNLKMSS
jgi:hypothetical protein